jgi:hypothetical protein
MLAVTQEHERTGGKNWDGVAEVTASSTQSQFLTIRRNHSESLTLWFTAMPRITGSI